MKKYLQFIPTIIIGLMLQACHQETTGTWQNSKIDTAVKKQISVQNQKLLKALIGKDAAAIKEMASPTLVTEMGSKLDTLVSKADLTKLADYNILDEFYTKNVGGKVATTVSSAHSNRNDYTVGYTALNADSYVSIFVSKNHTLNSMILAVYSRYDNEWKLDDLNVGSYSVLDKTAPDWYTDAVKLYQKGSIVSALNKVFMTFDLTHPGGTMLHYKDSTEIKAFIQKLLATANTQYSFPIVVDGVKTKPQIFAVDPKFVGDGKYQGVFPVIKYQSTIAIKDTIALKAENMAIQQTIGRVFKGIDTDESAIIYCAYNKLPNSKNSTPFRGFVQRLTVGGLQ
jgi:hypothetical protein